MFNHPSRASEDLQAQVHQVPQEEPQLWSGVSRLGGDSCYGIRYGTGGSLCDSGGRICGVCPVKNLTSYPIIKFMRCVSTFGSENANGTLWSDVWWV